MPAYTSHNCRTDGSRWPLHRKRSLRGAGRARRNDQRRDPGRIRRHVRPAPLRNRHVHRRPRAFHRWRRPSCAADGVGRDGTFGTARVSLPRSIRNQAERQSGLRPCGGVRQLQPPCASSASSTSTAYSAARTAGTSSISSARCGCPWCHPSHCPEASFSEPRRDRAEAVRALRGDRGDEPNRKGFARELVRRSRLESANHPARHSGDGRSKRSTRAQSRIRRSRSTAAAHVRTA